MPYISLESGSMTGAQKEALIRELTLTASQILAIPAEFFMVTIKELPDENIGIGGETIDKVKEAYVRRHQK